MHPNKAKLLLFFLFLAIFGFFSFRAVFADEVDDCIKDNRSDCIELIKNQITNLEKAIAPLQKESTGLQSKIASAKSQITKVETQVTTLTKNLVDTEADLEVQKILLSERVKRYYKNTKKFNNFMVFFSSNTSGSSLFQEYAWYQSIISRDKNSITDFSNQIQTLTNNKAKLEIEKTKLAKVKSDLETRFSFLATEIKKADNNKSRLNNLLTQLEAERIAKLNLPKTASSGISCVDDRNVDPGFGAGFAFFTFGIPHHVGLNQYGARGRAQAGQSAEEIVKAYYNNVEITGGKEGGSVIVGCEKETSTNKCQHNEFGQQFNHETMNIEEYLKHIYEMPTKPDWLDAALQAQAMAARSYALRVYSEKGWLAPSQADQVVKKELNDDRWIAAVNATRGKVITNGGQPIKAWFASTAGGYTFTSGDVWGGDTAWTKKVRDTSGEINSFDDLFAKAYDKDSKCFYAAQGYRKEYNMSAWLKPSEVADIVNAVMLGQNDSSTQKHLCQIDISNKLCPVTENKKTVYYDVWDTEKVKTELRNRSITPFNSISSATIADWNKNEGRVNRISFSGDAGTKDFDGSTFKTYFNSRAPANISIVGPLYNIEKR